MKALVTGANGLIGFHVVKALLSSEIEVRALTRVTSLRSHLEDLDDRVELVEGDVLDLGDVEAATDSCDLVFHCAVPFAYEGQVDGDVERVAVVGTENVLRAAHTNGVKRVVVTSSSVVFGYTMTPDSLDETHRPADTDREPGYVRSKLRQDEQTSRLADELGLDVVIACPTITVGADPTRLGPSNAIVVQYLSDPLSSSYTGGINVVAVADVAAGHVLLAMSGRRGGHYLLGGENLTWLDVHSTIADLCGVAAPRLTMAPTMTYVAAAAEETLARIQRRSPIATREQASMTGRYYWYSSAKAAAIGYRARSAREALAQTISWLAASSHVSREMRTSMTLHHDVYKARRQMPSSRSVEKETS